VTLIQRDLHFCEPIGTNLAAGLYLEFASPTGKRNDEIGNLSVDGLEERSRFFLPIGRGPVKTHCVKRAIKAFLVMRM
jgi:hypothetical protein